MKRILAILVATLLITAQTVAASTWSTVVDLLALSTVQLANWNGERFCSGFVIDNDRDYVLTALHCVDSQWALKGGIYIDTLPTEVVAREPTLDVAILKVAGINRPALQPNVNGIQVGDEVGAYGFGYGFPKAQFRAGVISAVVVNLSGYVDDPYLTAYPTSVWFVTDQPYIGGMSGGPIVDRSGKVVGIVQWSNDYMSMQKSMQEIYAQTKAFWR